jgi:hypothetical protein
MSSPRKRYGVLTAVGGTASSSKGSDRQGEGSHAGEGTLDTWSISAAMAIDKPLLMTGGALSCFSIASDVASAPFAARRLSAAIAVMNLGSPMSAILWAGRALS